jgi:hypothetical protein
MRSTVRTGAPLSLDTIRAIAPAVFGEEASPTRGPRYQYVPTIKPLELLLDKGWGVYEASQGKVFDPNKEYFARHSLRLRKLEDFNPGTLLEGVPEIVLTNAHDGTCAYSVKAAYWRLVCSNGMVAPKDLAAFRVVHTKGAKTSEDVLAAGERIITEQFPKMMESVRLLQSKTLSKEAQFMLAVHAMDLRYGSTLKPFPTEELLYVRRSADAGDTAWRVLNRIQENVVQGGMETRSVFSGRKSQVRAIEAIAPLMRINEGLWTKAAELAELA